MPDHPGAAVGTASSVANARSMTFQRAIFSRPIPLGPLPRLHRPQIFYNTFSTINGAVTSVKRIWLSDHCQWDHGVGAVDFSLNKWLRHKWGALLSLSKNRKDSNHRHFSIRTAIAKSAWNLSCPTSILTN